MRRILALTRYSRLGASSRIRFETFENELHKTGFEVHYSPLLDDAYLRGIYAGSTSKLKHAFSSYWRRSRSVQSVRDYDIVWIEKELYPFLPFSFERIPARKIVIDIDDAVFHNYDLSKNLLVRSFLGSKFDRIFARADAVLAGNSYLAERARLAGCRNVVFFPTVVDTEEYSPKSTLKDGRTIGWIGSPSTFKYVEAILPSLRPYLEKTGARLVCVGAGKDVPGVEYWPWEEGREPEFINRFDVGLMPLTDGPWERGKCAYKLIQYLACEVPVVASPVGANLDVVTVDKNGLFAERLEDWPRQIASLLSSAETRTRMGRSGRELVIQKYSLKATAPTLTTLFSQLTGA